MEERVRVMKINGMKRKKVHLILHLSNSHPKPILIQEEPFAWGNPDATNIPTLQPGSIEAQLATAAWKWRQKIHGPGGSGGEGACGKGAFHFITALIHTSAERKSAFTRLIRAGGGTVIKARCVSVGVGCVVTQQVLLFSR